MGRERTAGYALPFMVSRRGILAGLLSILAAGSLFSLYPGLDLQAAALFYRGGGHFAGDTPVGRTARHVFYLLPFGVLAAAVLLYTLRRLGYAVRAPTSRAVAVLALGLALGPGLLVNVVLKDHWHRPRPVQVTAFGGPDPFRPVLALDGACRRNCSFVSGEGSSAFWTIEPALMAPLPWRAYALASALLYAFAAALLRMAFGGHFLSDSVFAALFTWLVIAATWRALLGRRRPLTEC